MDLTENSNPQLVIHREKLNLMVSDLLQLSTIDFDSATALEQALVSTFAFGMIQTYGMLHEMTPPQVHALALAVFMDTFHYSAAAAAEGVQGCINATEPGYHDTMNAILHRGADGYYQHNKGDLKGLGQNMLSILDHFRQPPVPRHNQGVI